MKLIVLNKRRKASLIWQTKYNKNKTKQYKYIEYTPQKLYPTKKAIPKDGLLIYLKSNCITS